MRTPRHDVQLSTGRTIRHTRLADGTQAANPTTGAAEMTEDEWGEYCRRISGFMGATDPEMFFEPTVTAAETDS